MDHGLGEKEGKLVPESLGRRILTPMPAPRIMASETRYGTSAFPGLNLRILEIVGLWAMRTLELQPSLLRAEECKAELGRQ